MATFCLIHGNWHDGSCWAPLVERLRARGHHAVAPDLPFDDPGPTMKSARGPRSKPWKTSTALLWSSDIQPVQRRQRSWRRSGRRRCWSICPRFGFFPTPPDAPDVYRKGFPFPPKDVQGRMVWERESAIAAVHARLPRQTAQQLAKRLRPAASPVGTYPLGSHPDVATALIYTTEDEFFTPEWERYVAEHLLGVAPIKLPGGHFPMVENADLLAGTLDGLAVNARGPTDQDDT